MVRAFYTGWCREIIDTQPILKNGYALPMQGAGLGTALVEDRITAADAIRVMSRA